MTEVPSFPCLVAAVIKRTLRSSGRSGDGCQAECDLRVELGSFETLGDMTLRSAAERVAPGGF